VETLLLRIHTSTSFAVRKPTHLQSIDSTESRRVCLILQGGNAGVYKTSVSTRINKVIYSCIPFNDYGDGPSKMITVEVHSKYSYVFKLIIINVLLHPTRRLTELRLPLEVAKANGIAVLRYYVPNFVSNFYPV